MFHGCDYYDIMEDIRNCLYEKYWDLAVKDFCEAQGWNPEELNAYLEYNDE